jgi:hypothetical protein
MAHLPVALWTVEVTRDPDFLFFAIDIEGYELPLGSGWGERFLAKSGDLSLSVGSETTSFVLAVDPALDSLSATATAAGLGSDVHEDIPVTLRPGSYIGDASGLTPVN